MISVVIPLYNKEKQIANTLNTVLNQTFQKFEIIIVNDGSTDKSIEKVNKIKDSRIRVINQKNAGVSAARNRGIEEAKYDLIAFLDADDEWKPEYLETQYNLYLKYPECSVFATNYEFRDVNGKVTNTIIRKLHFYGNDGIINNYFEVASFSNPPLWTSAVVVRKEAIKSIGGFPLGIKSGEDLLTWAKLAANYKVAYSKRILAVFVSTNSDTDKSKAELRYEKEDKVLKQLKKLYENKHLPYLKSYIFRWYKIQCVILLEIGKRKECINKAIEAIMEQGSIVIFSCFVVLALLPPRIRKMIFNK